MAAPAALRGSEPGQIREEAALRIPRRCRGLCVGHLKLTGVIGTSGTSGTRKVVASSVIAKGVLKAVGKIVEVETRPGNSEKLSRDDLVFADGVIHISSLMKKMSFVPDLKACGFTSDIKQPGAVEGGTGVDAHAAGTFVGGVKGQAVAARKADGSCEMSMPPLVENDNVFGDGRLTF